MDHNQGCYSASVGWRNNNTEVWYQRIVLSTKVCILTRDTWQSHTQCCKGDDASQWISSKSDHPPDFLAAAKYPDPPNFCHRRKSDGKITATVNAAEFVKFHEPPQKLWLTFGWVYHFTKPRIVYFVYWLQERNLGSFAKCCFTT